MTSFRIPPALLGILLGLSFGCQSDRSAGLPGQSELDALLRQADTFPDRSLSVADAAIRLVADRKLPDTSYHAVWMLKGRALHAAGDAAGARQLLDSSIEVARKGQHWAAVGRMSLLSAPWATQENDGNPGSRTDRIGRYRNAVEAFDKAGLPLEKAFALSQLGFYLNNKSTPWAVDTMKLAVTLLQEHDGPDKEVVSCAQRIGIHSYGLGKPDEGRHYFDMAVRLLRITPDSAQAAPMLRAIAASIKETRTDSALYFYALADRLDPGLLDRLDFYRGGRLAVARIWIQRGQWQMARPALDSCLAFARQDKRQPLETRVLFHLGECAILAGDKAAAGRYFREAELLSDNLNLVPLSLGVIDGYLALARDLGDDRLEKRLIAKRAVIDPSGSAPPPPPSRPAPAPVNPTPSVSPATGSAAAVTPSSPASVSTADAPATKVAPVEGVPVVPSEPSSSWIPKVLSDLLERYPLIPIAAPPVLLLSVLAGWLLVRSAQRKRIKLFESYLRLLREGRDYRFSLHGASLADEKAAKSANRKQWTMFSLETWLMAEKPFVDPPFGPADCLKKLDITPELLEEVVQAHVDVDAATYLDHLRVAHSIGQMKDPAAKGLSLSDIRQASGFRNLLAFRSTFRISTGVTPGRYRAYCRAEMRKAAALAAAEAAAAKKDA